MFFNSRQMTGESIELSSYTPVMKIGVSCLCKLKKKMLLLLSLKLSPYVNNVSLKFLLKIRETQSNNLCIYSIKISIKYQGFFINKTKNNSEHEGIVFFDLKAGQ